MKKHREEGRKMAKAKKATPKYTSPYQEIEVEKNDVKFIIEVMDPEDKDEVERQTKLKYDVICYSTASYAESTLKRIAELHNKLFLCETEDAIMKNIVDATGKSFTKEFKPRAYVDVLKSKLDLIKNEDNLRIAKLTVQSLENYLCIHTMVKNMVSLVNPK
jgi:hypothetical protein